MANPADPRLIYRNLRETFASKDCASRLKRMDIGIAWWDPVSHCWSIAEPFASGPPRCCQQIVVRQHLPKTKAQHSGSASRHWPSSGFIQMVATHAPEFQCWAKITVESKLVVVALGTGDRILERICFRLLEFDPQEMTCTFKGLPSDTPGEVLAPLV